MCSSPDAPAPPPVLPEVAAAAPDYDKSAGSSKRKDMSKRRARTQGGTLLTGGQGLTNQASTSSSTLLGS